MSLSWLHRKTRLRELLKSQGDDDEDGLALDRLMHGQLVIGKTARTNEIDTIRFQDRDLQVLGTLEYGQFGVIDVVTCRLDSRVYVRKSVEKKFALRTREQCSPQFERDILLRALKTKTCWAPHLLCAFHTPTHLNLVMDYAEGGTLWDVLESSPLDGKISEQDLMWWAPQIISAIHWCHTQGFVHRDIKPHNLVITPTAHIMLIDFGSAAPLQPPARAGSRSIPKQYCLVPCGTCDYISPEILKAHEQALVALEIDESQDPVLRSEDEVYGLETDWWSLGAMLYEMAYGVAPFFAEDIRRTYFKIMDHRKNLKFNANVSLSVNYQDFIRRLLTDAEFRLGRLSVREITEHPLFDGVNWHTLSQQTAPPNLHLPQFSYATPEINTNTTERASEEASQPFAFSALFQSSVATTSNSPGLSILRDGPSASVKTDKSRSLSLSESTSASHFIGFSWGPAEDAFPEVHMQEQENAIQEQPPRLNLGLSPATLPKNVNNTSTPRSLRIPSAWLTPAPAPQLQNLALPSSVAQSTPSLRPHAFSTPIRPSGLPGTPYHAQTLPRTMSTVRRTIHRRAVSDREAMKQLVDCIGMSARKKVLESGRKPRILGSFGAPSRSASRSGGTGTGTSTIRKELRFLPPEAERQSDYPSLHYSSKSAFDPSGYSGPGGGSRSGEHGLGLGSGFGFGGSGVGGYGSGTEDELITEEDTSTDTGSGSEAPPSPSPSPRPGSAMSMMSMMSRRSGTPTLTTTFSQYLGTGTPRTPSTASLSYANGMMPGIAGRSRSGSGGSLRRMRSASGGSASGSTGKGTVTLEESTLDELEAKHASIMDDISSLETRLGQFQRLVGQ